MKKSLLPIFFVIISLALPGIASAYQADFWLWYYDQSSLSMSQVAGYGFTGVMTYGAYNNGDQMTYYFPSATLDNYWWANFSSNKIGTLATDAHNNGLQLLVDMEAINPWHWSASQHYYTDSIVRGMISDLHTAGADRWFDECFDLWGDWGSAMADQATSDGLQYQGGNDPMHIYHVAWIQEQTPTDFPTLFSHYPLVSMYYYRFVRDEFYETAHLAQHAALAFGFARAWGKPTALVYTASSNWGTDPSYWPGMLRTSALIEALRFRLDEIHFLGTPDASTCSALDISGFNSWLDGYVQKQDAAGPKPVLDIVVHLAIPFDKHNWMGLTVQADAIIWAASQAGYEIECSTTPIPGADAYYIVTRGYEPEDDGGTLDLTPEMTALFDSDKPVFLQCLFGMPFNKVLTSNWSTVLAACGIDPHGDIIHGSMPDTGIFNGQQFKFTGYDTRSKWWRTQLGTRLPASSTAGTEIIAKADNGTPLIMGRNRKYFIAGSCLSWQAGAVLARCLSGYGASPDSDVWGVAGPAVTALMSTHATHLSIDLPGVGDGSSIHVVHSDRYHSVQSDQTITYAAPFELDMNQFDSVVLDTVSLTPPAFAPEIPGTGDNGSGGGSSTSTGGSTIGNPQIQLPILCTVYKPAPSLGFAVFALNMLLRRKRRHHV